MPPKPADFEKAVLVLLRPPCLNYVKQLKEHIAEDPQYLFYHEMSVGLRIQRLLFNEGVRWPAETMIRYWSRALRVAIDRLEDL